jgi:hypothetical protein
VTLRITGANAPDAREHVGRVDAARRLRDAGSNGIVAAEHRSKIVVAELNEEQRHQAGASPASRS